MLGACEQVPETMRVSLETKSGIFSRILKNDLGRGGTWDFYWGALFPKGARRIESVQHFTLVNADELRLSLSLGDYAETGTRELHGDLAEVHRCSWRDSPRLPDRQATHLRHAIRAETLRS